MFSRTLKRVAEFSFRSFLVGPTEAKTRNQEQNRAGVQLYSWKERERERVPGVKDTLGIISGNVITKLEGRRLEFLSLHYVTKLCLRYCASVSFFTGAIVMQSNRGEACPVACNHRKIARIFCIARSCRRSPLAEK